MQWHAAVRTSACCRRLACRLFTSACDRGLNMGGLRPACRWGAGAAGGTRALAAPGAAMATPCCLCCPLGSPSSKGSTVSNPPPPPPSCVAQLACLKYRRSSRSRRSAATHAAGSARLNKKSAIWGTVNTGDAPAGAGAGARRAKGWRRAGGPPRRQRQQPRHGAQAPALAHSCHQRKQPLLAWPDRCTKHTHHTARPRPRTAVAGHLPGQGQQVLLRHQLRRRGSDALQVAGREAGPAGQHELYVGLLDRVDGAAAEVDTRRVADGWVGGRGR